MIGIEMTREPATHVTIHEYVAVKLPSDWGDQYLLACAISDEVNVLCDVGVESCSAAVVYTYDDFGTYFIMAEKKVLETTGGVYPFFFVKVTYVTDMFDAALLDPIVAKYELLPIRRYRFDDGWGGTFL